MLPQLSLLLLELIVVLEQEIALEEYWVLEYLLGALLTSSLTLKLLQRVAGELSVESSSPQGSY